MVIIKIWPSLNPAFVLVQCHLERPLVPVLPNDGAERLETAELGVGLKQIDPIIFAERGSRECLHPFLEVCVKVSCQVIYIFCPENFTTRNCLLYFLPIFFRSEHFLTNLKEQSTMTFMRWMCIMYL